MINKENETMNLTTMSKMYKMYYMGNKMTDCVRIETAVKNSDYATSTIKSWINKNDKWATAYDKGE